MILVFVLMHLILSGARLGVVNILTATIVTGSLVQILNNFVNEWDPAWISLGLVLSLGASLSITTWNQVRTNTSLFGHLLKTGPLVLFGAMTLVAYFSYRFPSSSFLVFISGEDNSKWANYLAVVETGSVSSELVNGTSGVGVAALSLGSAFQRCLELFLGDSGQTQATTLSTLLTTHLFIILLTTTMLGTAYRSECRRVFSFPSVIGSLLVGSLMIQTASFGFLTFNAAILCVVVVFHYLNSEGQFLPNNSLLLVLCLLILFAASFTWLPLVFVLVPLVLLVLLRLIRGLLVSRVSRLLIPLIAVGGWFFWNEVMYDRFNYFRTKGSGGDLVWRELLISGGGTPNLTQSTILIGLLIVVYTLRPTTSTMLGNHRIVLTGVSLAIPYVLVEIISSTFDQNTSYTVNKIALFTFIAVVSSAVIVAPASGRNTFVPGNALIVVAALLFVYGGDFRLTANRIVNAISQPSASTTDSRWIAEVQSNLSQKRSVPVGCLNVNEAGGLTVPDGPSYVCTRVLTGLAGGEERLIGLHAFTSARFSAVEMANSLQHYNGEDLSEVVILLNSETYDVVALATLHDIIDLANNPPQDDLSLP